MTSHVDDFVRVREGVCGEKRAKAPLRVAFERKPTETPPETVRSALHACVAVKPDPAEQLGAPYELTEDVATAVNVALALGQPLLVTGEPGCGKTSLAYGVALQLGQSRVWRFDTQSTTTSDELFYRFDHVRRFHDASVRERDTLREAAAYVELQAFGAALRSEDTEVILLDEVDKAPRDLPNDLLRRIEEPMRFQIREVTGEGTLEQKARHLVIITSNHERELPEPFLRRCAFVHLAFPEDPARLVKIVRRHLGGGGDDGLTEAAAARFLDVRKKLRENAAEGMARLPGTSELIAWTRTLRLLRKSPGEVRDAPLDARLGASAVLKHWRELPLFASPVTTSR